MHMAHLRIEANRRELTRNADESMVRAAEAAFAWCDTLPNSGYYIHEASPNAAGSGHEVKEAHIKQFPEHGDPFVPGSAESSGDGASAPVHAGDTA
jgi:hypothetical protein